MKNLIDWTLIVLWTVVGIISLFQPVSKIVFYCCLGCLLMAKVEQILRRKL